MKIPSIKILCLLLFIVESFMLLFEIFQNVKFVRIKNIQDKRLLIQKEYILKKLMQNEKEHRIHHDIEKHMEIVKLLYKKKLLKELEEYVNTYIHEYSENIFINTGNLIADYFIEKTIKSLSKQTNFEYKVVGKFPLNLIVSDNDLCAIMGNALDNARRAISNIEKGGRLYIEIRNLNNHFCLTIRNNKSSNTDKYGSKTNGTGMWIMKTIVKKYGGKIKFIDNKEAYLLHIII